MNQYFINDARYIDELPIDHSVDLIVTSPPYFDMKDYGSKNQIGFGQTYEKYLDDIKIVFKKCYDVSNDTASLWVIVDNLKKDGDIKLLPFDMAKKIEEAGWKLRDIIIWQKDKTVPYTHPGEMRNIFEYVLYFTKTNKFKYYRERITSINDLKEWWQRYPERYSPTGKSPTNIWQFPIPLQGSWGKKYIKHFCPLPEGLIERIIHLSSDVHDVVLDPFAGSGAVLSAAFRLQRKYLGCDLNESYRKMFLNYIKEIKPIDVEVSYNDSNFKRFSKSIEKLRLLKFPKKLIIEYKKRHPDNFFISSVLVIPDYSKFGSLQKNKFLACSYYFITSKNSEGLALELKELTTKKPLSKFGIECEIYVGDIEDIWSKLSVMGRKLWRFDNGIIYRSGACVNRIEPDIFINTAVKKIPPIFSTINLKKDELELPL